MDLWFLWWAALALHFQVTTWVGSDGFGVSCEIMEGMCGSELVQEG